MALAGLTRALVAEKGQWYCMLCIVHVSGVDWPEFLAKIAIG